MTDLTVANILGPFAELTLFVPVVRFANFPMGKSHASPSVADDRGRFTLKSWRVVTEVGSRRVGEVGVHVFTSHHLPRG